MDAAVIQPRLTAGLALRRHWPEYFIEGGALGLFMVSAGLVTLLVQSAVFPLRALIASAGLRRLLIGLAMGTTAIGLIRSRWGKRSGAHMNPAVTLTFYCLGKVAPWDAVFYVVSQFLGGALGVLLVWSVAGSSFAAPGVNYVVTMPGAEGVGLAFIAELGISALLMLAVLFFSNHPRLSVYTAPCVGALLAAFIAIEAPLSGMSMNPARTFASAFVARRWRYLWVYFTAPPLGMLLAAAFYRLVWRRRAVACAKLLHPLTVRCIHCGFDPAAISVSQPRSIPEPQS